MDRKTKGRTVWFLGIPCSGKTTLGDELAKIHPAIRLDGDNVREGLSEGLGFSDGGRLENIRRCAEVAELLNKQGHDVICSFVTPLKIQQTLIKTIIKDVKLVYVLASVETCMERDVKGMWKMAREGKILGFTGYDADFHIPDYDFFVNTETELEQCLNGLDTLFSS